jgi:hypothetical protein
MKYTIRNKRTQPILTFTAKTWNKITESYSPEAYVIAWSSFCKEYKKLTGKQVLLDYTQKTMFNEWVG